MPTVLVVDDNAKIVEVLAEYLRADGFTAVTAGDGPAALARAKAHRPDLALVDVMLPGIDGLELTRRFQADGIPVILVTARSEEVDRLVGLELGADDYITKPFSLDELLARIEAILRRVSPSARWNEEISVGDLVLDQDGRSVHRGGQRVEMSRTEFDVLEFLMRNVGRVVSKQQILEHVWQYDFGGESTVVETYISYLRKKLDPLGPPLIHTMRGVGYVLRNPDEG